MPEEYAPEDFRALQAETRGLLARVIATRPNPQAWTPTWVRVGATTPHVAATEGQPGRHVLSLQGATRDLFLLRVAHLLRQVNTGMLTRCPNCDTIFLRKSNQTFCSKRCTNRVMQQRHRQRQEATDTAPLVS
jgi:predicted RNA-binding Zn ribbon-like protein